jgi:hypothetical protein
MRKIFLGGIFIVLTIVGLQAQPSSAASAGEPSEDLFTFQQRMEWASRNAVSLRRVAGYAVSSAIATATNSPREYGPHWDGYGKRVGLRMSTGATGLFMEAAIGSLWGEDPRYQRAAGQPLKARLWNVAKMTVMARNVNGELRPAYARYISISANSYASNLWRADSQATPSRAAGRIPVSLLDRMIANTFSEFAPDLMRPFHKQSK